MKILLILVLSSFAITGLKDRLKAVQQTQEQILQKEDPKQMELIPEPVKSYESMTLVQPRHVYGDRITKLEVQQQYMQRDLDNAVKSLQETREVLIEVVSTLEKANKVTEVQTDKSARTDTIINVVLGIVTLLSGGGGFIAWKNKHLVFKPKEDKSTTDIQDIKKS